MTIKTCIYCGCSRPYTQRKCHICNGKMCTVSTVKEGTPAWHSS